MDTRLTIAHRFCSGITFLKFVFVTLALTGSIYTPAYAQDITSREGIALQNQILELRQALSQMQKSLDSRPASSNSHSSHISSSSSDSDLLSQLLDRVNSLEQHQRDMRGDIDQLKKDLQQKTDALSKQIADNQFAAQENIKNAVAAKPTEESPINRTSSPDNLLKIGKEALLRKDYATARENAETVLKTAKGSLRIDARFLLAQSLAGQKQYRRSAVAYYDAYKLAPKSARAPDCLLGITATLLALNNKKAACEALDKLKKEFPHPTDRISRASSIYAKRGSCH